jgi:putative ABC transport system permease protein
MIHDLIVTVRTLAKQPGYVISIVLTLALGIGASAMMFSLVDAALLRPLPFHQPDRLVMLTGVAGPQRSPRGASFPEIADWRSMNTTLGDVALYDEISLNLRTATEAVRVDAEMVSASYFAILGVQAARGRTFLPAEDSVPDQHPVAVVSGRFWRDRLGGDPAVLQRTLILNDRTFQIVGVMAEGFAGLSFDTDVWVPSMMVSLTGSVRSVQNRGDRWLLAVGRLKDGIPRSRAQDDLTRVALLLEKQHPQFNRQRGVDVDGLKTALLGGTDGQVLALFGAVLILLAVACANVAGLQLVRASARRRELAVRLALGARLWHVLRQMLTESVLLSLAAGTLGAIAAAWGTTAAISWMPDGALPRHVRPFVDPRTLAFTCAISTLVGIVVAVLPTVAASRGNLADVIKQGGRTLESGLGAIRRPSAQQLLVTVQIAAAMVLLTVAGLVARSLARQASVELGMDPRGVTIAQLALPAARYAPDQRIVFVERLEADLRAMPGIRVASISSDLPLTGNASASSLLPDVAAAPDAALRYYRHFVTPDYFATLGIPIVAGRAFTWRDRVDTPRVAIVNDAAAVRIWGSVNAVGRRFRLGGGEGQPVEVVGVAGTVRMRDLTTDLSGAVEPDVYFPYAQVTDRFIQIAVRSTDGSAAPAASLQQAVSAIDAGLPLFRVRLLDDAVGQQTSTARFVASLLTLFSGATLLLAGIGLYGLIAYVVSLSRREIAIRLALGANRGRVARLIVRNGMILVGVGVAAGALVAYAAGRAIEDQLFQTKSGDPATYLVVAALLAMVAFLASVAPTRRALRANPHAALRAE